ncbi:hypothetical protein BT528P2_00029 [Bacteroides phage BT528P2]|nr:hypothetical protein BT498P1_00024 [Bacteroides phage BT498P1]WAX09320.1 hypothetical protein BT528P1_00029 [Bacteroides phage BT528P1]WAX09366.1 hypothetical protein BT528P2_00029 [Bacteroides phage BT528P2]
MRTNIWKQLFVATMRRELINGHYDIESLCIYAASRNAAYQQARKYMKEQGGMTLISLSY